MGGRKEEREGVRGVEHRWRGKRSVRRSGWAEGGEGGCKGSRTEVEGEEECEEEGADGRRRGRV